MVCTFAFRQFLPISATDRERIEPVVLTAKDGSLAALRRAPAAMGCWLVGKQCALRTFVVGAVPQFAWNLAPGQGVTECSS